MNNIAIPPEETLDEFTTLEQLAEWGIVGELPPWMGDNGWRWDLADLVSLVNSPFEKLAVHIDPSDYIGRWDENTADLNEYISKMGVKSWGELLGQLPIDVAEIQTFVVYRAIAHYARTVVIPAVRAAGWNFEISR